MESTRFVQFRVYAGLIIFTGLLSFLSFEHIGLAQKIGDTYVPDAKESLQTSSVYFEENRGQYNEAARYLVRGTNDYSLFLTAKDAVYIFQSPKVEGRKGKSTAVYMSLVGGNEFAKSEGTSMTEHRTNYFKGKESEWRTEIPNFRGVRFEEVLPGVDTVWEGTSAGGIEYSFEVRPMANMSQIEWEINGAEEVRFNTEGDLVIKTEFGEFVQPKPRAEQSTNGIKALIESGFSIYQINEKTFRAQLVMGEYDRKKGLSVTISSKTDPPIETLSSISFSTYLGGTSDDIAREIAVDSTGNVFIAGSTTSNVFPTVPGSFDTTNGGWDGFVAKMNAAGSALIYSTYFGGSDEDYIEGLAIDTSGNAYFGGRTKSGDMPTVGGSFDTVYNGGNFDAFIAKLDPAGSALVYSTFLGGVLDDRITDLTIDSSGNAFVTGFVFTNVAPTIDNSFPTTVGAFDTTANESWDCFVTKLNAAGTALSYSTFVGGNADDYGQSIAVDSGGNAYVVGNTPSPNFPVSVGAFDTTLNGSYDIFAVKINASGASLDYGTYIGGSAQDFGARLEIDSGGNVYLTGESASSNFPTTPGAFDLVNSGASDAIIVKINSSGSALDYSSFIGADGVTDRGYGIALDSSGFVYVTGDASDGFPMTVGAYDTSFNGATTDVFLAKFDVSGTPFGVADLVYSSYLGGSGEERGNGLFINSSGDAFIIGQTSSPNFPTNAGAFDSTANGGLEGFVTKFTLAPTAANVSIGGRVLGQYGSGVANAIVTLTEDDGFIQNARTNSFGYYRFNEILVGQTVAVSVFSKGRLYRSQVLSVYDNIHGLDFVPIQ